MDLKEYLKIFKKNFKAFLATVIIFILAGFAFQILQVKNYQANLTLNITRLGKQQTDSYKYDDFYRLQADERFADTVVRWLNSPRIASEIYAGAGINPDSLSEFTLSKLFKAKRLSSQMIQVTFKTKEPKTAEKITDSLTKTLNNETEKLNAHQKEEAWFTIISDNPIIRVRNYSFLFIFAISSLIGIFVGFWTVFIKHYLKE